MKNRLCSLSAALVIVLSSSPSCSSENKAGPPAQPATAPAAPVLESGVIDLRRFEAPTPATPTAPQAQEAPMAAPTPVAPATITTPSGLQYVVLKPGTGPKPEPGQTVTAHYTGWLTNGTKFDSSVDRKQPFSFTVGRRQVIAAWDEALLDMQVGEKRKLTIPPALGYGARGTPGGPIPPNATLIFEVELLGIR